MIKKILDIIIILLLLLAGFSHIVRLIYHVFTPNFLKKYEKKFIPDKKELILYCILVIGVVIYALEYKLGRL